MASELKPCPFCGSHDVWFCGMEDFAIECRDCDSAGPGVYRMKYGDKAKEEAARRWNTRAPTTDDEKGME